MVRMLVIATRKVKGQDSRFLFMTPLLLSLSSPGCGGRSLQSASGAKEGLRCPKRQVGWGNEPYKATISSRAALAVYGADWSAVSKRKPLMTASRSAGACSLMTRRNWVVTACS